MFNRLPSPTQHRVTSFYMNDFLPYKDIKKVLNKADFIWNY